MTDLLFEVRGIRRGSAAVAMAPAWVLVRDGRRIERLVDGDAEAEDGVMAMLEDSAGHLWVWRDLSSLARYRRHQEQERFQREARATAAQTGAASNSNLFLFMAKYLWDE